MTILSRLIGCIARLPPAETYDIAVERNLKVPMPDGVDLLADHYYPRQGDKRPTILVRSPYGRAGFFGMLFARPFAERGFQVLIQSCRGTFGSGGAFEPLLHEQADGLATFAWLKRQPWFSGEAATTGPSYLGIVQWAIASQAGPELKAMAPQITASEFNSMHFAGGSFALDTSLSWVQQMAYQEDPPSGMLRSRRRHARALREALMHLPLCDGDQVATGQHVPYYQQWLAHDASSDEFWRSVDFSNTVAQVTAPVHLVGGWYDIFLPGLIADYARLRQAGRQPYLTIGPWSHTSMAMFPYALREAIIWLRAQLLGDRSRLRDAPVRVFVMGAQEWRDYPAWPPEGYQSQRWYLQAGNGLATTTPMESAPDRYHYDPADPTPAVGGVSLSGNSGQRDNRTLEARPDVLVYSSTPLDHAVEVIGPVRIELRVTSSLAYTDFYARLCDVDPSGKSTNISDGLLRLRPERPVPNSDDCLQVVIDLWPTACRFKAGHRIRLQVSSGAHPRFACNTGSAEPLATATQLIAADQAVYHTPSQPSALILPVKE